MSKLTAEDWNERYRRGDLPWDTGTVEPLLINTLDHLGLSHGHALEIGCGSGTNAIDLARRGFQVVAIDISVTAIDMAREKFHSAGVNILSKCHDILESAAVTPHSMDFVFDRGCFHSVTDEQRRVFSRRVADALGPKGYWLTLCGNADQKSADGPPRLTAAHITAVVEPQFQIVQLFRAQFDPSIESTGHLSWQVLMQSRA